MVAPHPPTVPAPQALGARAGWRRLWPDSLFGRLLLVLGFGLLLAQAASALINLAERDRLLTRSFGMQSAQRIADIVALLDGLGPAERSRVLAVFSSPPLVLSLSDVPRVAAGDPPSRPAQMFAVRLRNALGEGREVRVAAREAYVVSPQADQSSGRRRPGMGAGMGMDHPMGMGPGMMGPGRAGGTPPAVLRTEVRLLDGQWAAIDHEQPPTPSPLPLRLAASLAVLLASVLLLSYVAVRWVVRPLRHLTLAADAFGRDLERAPLPETGPLEVRQAARAFNTMQQRLAEFIHERARVLAALSHDLKTPLTRMRLRAELLDDDELRTKFESDLGEMQTMVAQTLEVLRGLGDQGHRVPVDVNAVVASLEADQAALGRALRVQGRAQAPWTGVESLLKRCLGNVVDNAFAYGGAATLRIEDSAQQLVICVDDPGPGIRETDLEKVFEPFHRLEASRNRATGGTGLGLGIARNIARSFGGELVLRNRALGGLTATLTLPRSHVPSGA